MKIFDNQEMKNYSNMRVGGKAKRRIIRAKGFVKTPNSSMTGINGIGAFSNTGT